MKAVGFLRALLGVCGGTAIFDELRFNSWWRLVFHTFILALLLALVIVGCEVYRVYPGIGAFRDRFCARFGKNIYVTGDGIAPEIEPKTSRRLFLPDGGLLCYVGSDSSGPRLTAAEASPLKFILVWSYDRFGGAVRGAENEWAVVRPGAAADLKSAANDMMGARPVSTVEMVARLNTVRAEKRFDAAARTDDDTVKTPVAMLTSSLTAVYAAGQFCWRFGTIWIAPWIYTGLFALVFRLTSFRRLQVLSIAQFWKIGIYAGFPAAMVAGCFPAFDLPYLNFGTAYVIGMAIYWMVIVNRIERGAVSGGGCG